MTNLRPGRGWIAPLALILVAGACGPGPTPSPNGPSPSTLGPTVSPPVETPASTLTTELLRVYLVLGFGGQTGLVPVLRVGDSAGASPEAAIRALLAGPTDLERAAQPAIRTAIPPGIELRGLTVDGGVATVDLSEAFEAATEDALPTAMRVAQVAYTLTQFPGIETAQIEVEGVLVTAIGPDGFPQDRPFRRADFTDQLPPLFVDQPAWGATIASPVRIVGLANAFEATFQVRISDADGRGLAAGPVTASCGTGCWGDFDVSVPFSVQAAGPGVLQAFELSPRDGSMDNLREYPVTLTP